MTLPEALKDASYPVFGADSYTNTAQRIGRRMALGKVYFNVREFRGLKEFAQAPPKCIIIAEDHLVREMIDAELYQQEQNPSRRKAPLFFLRNEQFKILHIAAGKVHKIEAVGLQNIKVVAPPIDRPRAQNHD